MTTEEKKLKQDINISKLAVVNKNKLEKNKQLSLFGKEGYYISNWDKLETSDIAPKPTSKTYFELLNAITTSSLDKLPITDIVSVKGADFCVKYNIEDTGGITQRNCANIAGLIELYLSHVLHFCWDWEKEELKQNYFYLSYENVRKLRIVSDDNPNIVQIIKKYHKNIASFLIESEPTKKTRKNISFYIQGQDRALFLRDIDFIKSTKNENNGHAVIHISPNNNTWRFFFNSYIGAMFLWKFTIKNSKARALVNYCEFAIRANSKKNKACKIKFDNLFEKINIKNRNEYNKKKYNPKDFLLEILIPEIEEAQRIYGQHETNGEPIPNLFFSINEEEEMLIFEAGEKDKNILKNICQTKKQKKD